MSRIVALPFAFVSGVAFLLAASTLTAREPSSNGFSAAAAAAPIDLLEAESQGLVDVKYIPNDSRSAQIVVGNRSGRPLTLRMPPAFAGVPVLGQMGGGGGFGAGGIGGGGAQTTGGGGLNNQGMNGMGGGGGMGGMGGMGGGGAFAIPAERTRVLKVTTVCLEHGKPEPSSRMPYKLTAIESFSTDPALTLVLKALGRGELSQKVAQAAAWHLADGLGWDRLAAKKIDHAGGVPDEPYFSAGELMAARRAVAVAGQILGQNQSDNARYDQTSVSEQSVQ
jgi:hypothetical protein